MKGKVSPLNPRSCIGCRSREDSMNLLRVVCIEGQLLPDPGRVLPGRGAWVHNQCASKAIERKAFSRALRVDHVIDSSLLVAYISDASASSLSGGSNNEWIRKI